MIRLATVLAAALLLAGCGATLDTTYGSDYGGSINGCQVLRRVVEERTRLRPVSRLSPLLERDCRLVVHLATAPGLPSGDAMTWLTGWLAHAPGRTALVILRDGSTTAWLCRRWLAELDALPADLRADDHATQREGLERALAAAGEPAWPATAAASGPLRATWQAPQAPRRLHPAALVPATMTAGLRLEAAGSEPLIAAELADGSRVPWALALPVGGSRLMIVANATPLLDGALADAAARTLAGRLLDAALPPGERPLAAWVATLAVHDGEPEPANPMALLFARPPIAWAAWHLVAVGLLLIGAAALVVGRRSDPPAERRARFGRHLDALARQLREGGHARWCVQAIARLRGLPRPPAGLDDAAARAWLTERTAPIPGPRP